MVLLALDKTTPHLFVETRFFARPTPGSFGAPPQIDRGIETVVGQIADSFQITAVVPRAVPKMPHGAANEPDLALNLFMEGPRPSERTAPHRLVAILEKRLVPPAIHGVNHHAIGRAEHIVVEQAVTLDKRACAAQAKPGSTRSKRRASGLPFATALATLGRESATRRFRSSWCAVSKSCTTGNSSRRRTASAAHRGLSKSRSASIQATLSKRAGKRAISTFSRRFFATRHRPRAGAALARFRARKTAGRRTRVRW